MIVRYSVQLNTGEIIVNSVTVENNINVLRAIVKDVKDKVNGLRVSQARYHLNLAKQIYILYRLYDSKNKICNSEDAGPYTFCI